MPAVIPLMLMEMNGFGLDANELASLKQVLQFQAAWLELKAYQLAGRQFNISSAKDVNQVTRFNTCWMWQCFHVCCLLGVNQIIWCKDFVPRNWSKTPEPRQRNFQGGTAKAGS